jgi:hypothetical protein
LLYENFSANLFSRSHTAARRKFCVNQLANQGLEKIEMRHFTLATGLAFALAAMFAMAPAQAEFGGPMKNDQGQCRVFGANNQNSTYYHWDTCPKSAAAAIVHHRSHHKG